MTEEQAEDIVAKAEILAEEQAEDLPRRKGARPAAPVADGAAEGLEGAEGGEGAVAAPTMDEIFGGEAEGGEAEPAPGDETEAGGETGTETEGEEEGEGEESHDLALATEGSRHDQDGHEVTFAPSDADQDETKRIVTEAVESGASDEEIVAREAGAGRNVPPLPPTEPFTTDEAEERDEEARPS